MEKMDERYWLASKGRNSAFINKLVTEIGHTSERKVGVSKGKGAPPPKAGAEGKGNRI